MHLEVKDMKTSIPKGNWWKRLGLAALLALGAVAATACAYEVRGSYPYGGTVVRSYSPGYAWDGYYGYGPYYGRSYGYIPWYWWGNDWNHHNFRGHRDFDFDRHGSGGHRDFDFRSRGDVNRGGGIHREFGTVPRSGGGGGMVGRGGGRNASPLKPVPVKRGRLPANGFAGQED